MGVPYACVPWVSLPVRVPAHAAGHGAEQGIQCCVPQVPQSTVYGQRPGCPALAPKQPWPAFGV